MKCLRGLAAPLMRPCSDRPKATGCASRYVARHRDRARFHALWRESQIRRRQGHSRRNGPIAGDARRGRGRQRHHQCSRARPLGHRQMRRRPQGRAHRGARQGRQSRIQPGVDIIIGPGTEVIAGEGKILTPAASIRISISSARSKSRRSFDVGHQSRCLGGGTGPATGTLATTCNARPLAHRRA